MYQYPSTHSKGPRPLLPDYLAVVKKTMHDKRLTVPQIARQINTSPGRVYRLLRSRDWRFSEAVIINQLLEINIFELFMPAPEPAAETNSETDNPAAITELKKQNELLALENKLLREMVDALKKKE